MELTSRKKNRLQNYDYSKSGYYFVTICTSVRYEDILCSILPSLSTEDLTLGSPTISLTHAGEVVSRYIQNIDSAYSGWVCVDSFVIMPDHIHLILHIQDNDIPPEGGPPRAAAPTLSSVVNTLKGLSTKEIGYPIWQRSYYDHIIRGEADLASIRLYIQNNPVTWINKD